MQDLWQWEHVRNLLPILLDGAVVTIEISLLSYLLALVVGLLLALLRRNPRRWVNRPTTEVIEFVRSTPLLVQIYFLFYIGPQFGVTLHPWIAGILALGIHYGTYTSEVYRAGLEGVRKGQWEAAIALNLSKYQTYRDIILPQAIPPIIPTLGNYLIGIFKETPLLSVITIAEMLTRAKDYASENFRYTEAYIMVGVFFLVLSIPASYFVNWSERRFKRGYARK
jgi:polar amino acid transport system permease protein